MNVFDLVASLSLDASSYKSDLGNAESLTSSAGSKIGGALATAGKIAGVALTATTTATVAFAKSAVSAGADFDKAMSQVGATMGENAQKIVTYNGEAMSSIDALRIFAQEMGSTTAFSATESAEALNYMALAGYDAETSFSMLPTVLNLASAGSIDLASASDMVTDAQTALGLTIEETSEMVDKMALTSSKTNTSVAQLGEAFLTIGGNAKNLSGGTTELSQVLGILADNGIKGAEAGTHLRNILLALNPTTDSAVEAFEELGINAYDAEGNLKPLSETFGDLQDALKGASSQQRTDIINKIFNKTDLASVNALLDTSADRWEELTEAIDGAQGSAQAMADTQLDNLAGDVTLFKSALEGAKIAVSDELTPSLREFVQFGSDGLSQLTQAFQSDGLEGAMEVFGTLLSDAVGKIIEKLPDMAEAGLKLLESLVQGITDNLPTLINSALQVLNMLGTSIIDNLPMLLEATLQIIVQLAQGIAEALPELIPTIVDVIITVVNTLIDNVDMLVESAIAIIIALTEGIFNALPRLIERLPELVAKIVKKLIELAPELIKSAGELVAKLLAGIVTNWVNIIKKLPELVTQVKDVLIEKFKVMKNVGENIVNGIWEGISAGWTWLTDKVKALAQSLVDGVKKVLHIESPSKVFAEIGGFMAEGLGDGWDEEFGDVNKNILNDFNYTDELGNIGVSTKARDAENNVNLTEAIKEALDSYEIKWDERNLGRLVAKYA